MRNIAVAMVFAVLVVAPALGAELAGVSLPDSVTVEGTTLVLNGLGLREATFLKVDVYVAGLYLEERRSEPEAILDSEGPKQLVMRFVRKVTSKQLVKAWDEGFEKNAGDQLGALDDGIAKLNSWMSGVAAGDTMTFTEIPGTGVRVAVGDDVRGTIPGSDFARALWSIWLGPHPPNARLKEGLLGRDAR